MSTNRNFAEKALRVLGAAFCEYSDLPEDVSATKLEKGLIFLGLAGMIDPIRPEVVAAVKQCKSAGIRVVMITGDHRDTAAAIAMQLGIITDASQAITGAQLDEISEEEFTDMHVEMDQIDAYPDGRDMPLDEIDEDMEEQIRNTDLMQMKLEEI